MSEGKKTRGVNLTGKRKLPRILQITWGKFNEKSTTASNFQINIVPRCDWSAGKKNKKPSITCHNKQVLGLLPAEKTRFCNNANRKRMQLRLIAAALNCSIRIKIPIKCCTGTYAFFDFHKEYMSFTRDFYYLLNFVRIFTPRFPSARCIN